MPWNPCAITWKRRKRGVRVSVFKKSVVWIYYIRGYY